MAEVDNAHNQEEYGWVEGRRYKMQWVLTLASIGEGLALGAAIDMLTRVTHPVEGLGLILATAMLAMTGLRANKSIRNLRGE